MLSIVEHNASWVAVQSVLYTWWRFVLANLVSCLHSEYSLLIYGVHGLQMLCIMIYVRRATNERV